MKKTANTAPQQRAQSVMLRVRVLPEVDELIRRASDKAAARRGTGTVSDWIRATLKAAAERELGESG